LPEKPELFRHAGLALSSSIAATTDNVHNRLLRIEIPSETMNRPSTIDLRFVTMIAIIMILLSALACHQSSSRSSGKQQDSANVKRTTVLVLPPTCPPAGVAPLQRSSPGTGDHKVFLKWNASVMPSGNPDSNAVGYCLYRSKTKSTAKKKPTCSECERVNIVPIPGTACVDDLVKDGATYFYVATAINRDSQISSSSNEVPVAIPRSPKSARPAPPGAYPLCRGASSR
jgi:hypothetical protein